MGRGRQIVAALGWALIVACVAVGDEPASRDGIEFFELRVRPLLSEHCSRCHGNDRHENDLRLNSAAGIKRGGDRGPPIVAGSPDESTLIRAVRYADEDLQMPPRGKLSAEQIADLEKWVKLGAPLPTDESATVTSTSAKFDLVERRKHWSYQPVQTSTPPAVADASWSRTPVDAFIRHKLDAALLSPAAPADRRTLVRRLTFDLTGLPPLPAELAEFLTDSSPDAYERLADRLLASPRYGERWGRHWLDVVRYSETLGFEFDYDLYHAWRYRDYVIRALNADLPYDQFVIEHLAGDLVQPPRRNWDGNNESILATGFFWMVEGKQTPVDIRQEQMDRIDNQIDTLGKAFLGQTIACARCHDHKFDAIATRDYYALAGYLRSSRFQQAFIDTPERYAPVLDELTRLRSQVSDVARPIVTASWQKQLTDANRYLLAARAARRGMDSATAADRAEAQRETAREFGISAERLERWMAALADNSASRPQHPLRDWNERAAGKPASATAAGAEAAVTFQRFEDFSDSTFERWFVTGAAFGSRPARAGEIVVGEAPERPIARLATGGADSGSLAVKLQGELRSPTFAIEQPFLHVRLAGRNSRVNLVIDGNTLIMNPMYGKLTTAPDGAVPLWATMPVERWLGRRAYLEISDCTIPLHRLNPPPSAARVPAGKGDGYVVVHEVVFSNSAEPPVAARRVNADTPEELAAAYQLWMQQAAQRWSTGRAETDDLALLNWLLENGLLDGATSEPALSVLLARYRDVAASLPAPQRAPALADGTGEDEFIFLRGNHRTPGEPARRGPPQTLTVDFTAPNHAGSGRLELAQSLARADNPLPARVLVNRLWQHHFGGGLVRTPDDFGRMGEPPSHPELLDYLAAELVHSGWSLKSLHRQMVGSATYRMSSSLAANFEIPTPQSEISNSRSQISNLKSATALDPDNRLLSRMPVRRLEAEAIRDSILAVSGRLDSSWHGPSVLPFLTPYMEGRGKPQSGPLDGAGRRSIYVNARRNFLTPLLLSFDYPVTFTPIGRRGTSSIPAQALTLMNDPFVVEQAREWARRVLREGGSTPEERLEFLYAQAFSRQPTGEERQSSREFLQQQAARHGVAVDDERVWTDLCHVLINVKEFIFID